MIEAIQECLSNRITQRAMLACLMIGFANGYVSAFVVLKKSALKLGTISHGLLPGLALAALIGGLTSWSMLLGGMFAALFIGLGSLFMSRGTRLDHDTALGILYTTAFGAGLILIYHMRIQGKLDEWLFGSIMGMQDSDLWIAFWISVVAVVILTAWQRSILILLFEPNIAQSLGVPVRALNYALFGVTLMVLVSSLQAVGCILSVGLLVIPAATIYMFSDNPSTLFYGGGLLGSTASVFAFVLSYALSWPAGATLIAVLGVIFILAFVFSPRYGLLAKRAVD